MAWLRLGFATIVLCGMSLPLSAAPFIVSDPLHAAATHCGFKLDTEARTNVPVAMSGTNKICKMDISAVSVGTHTVDATAVPLNDPNFSESAPSAPFTFTRPGPPTTPGALALVQVSGVPTVQSPVVGSAVTHCEWTVDGTARADAPVAAGPRCALNVADLASGQHVLTVAAVKTDSIWGRLESAPSANFTYVVPTSLPVPSGIKLAP